MNAQEQTLIENLFQQLRQLDGQPKDGQAEAWVRQQAQQTPDALYWLTQRGLLLEQALQQAQQQEAQLQAQLVEARAAAAKPAGGSSSFLGAGLDTHFGRSPDANLASRSPAGYAPSYPQNNAVPAGYGDTPAPASSGRWFGAAPAAPAPIPAPMPAQPSAGSAAGGFLGQAAASAAGVAGGMLLFNGLSHLWSNPVQAATNPSHAASSSPAADSASTANTSSSSGDNAGLDQLAQQAGRDHVDSAANRWMPDTDSSSGSSSSRDSK
ncbi:DUF2076 family protein, partial [Comamonas sp. B-9]|uniref:DUF2076 family protein n=1 Tax=Comamonas sp. B-9 TaxID=1055192 RepID=UPI0019552746